MEFSDIEALLKVNKDRDATFSLRIPELLMQKIDALVAALPAPVRGRKPTRNRFLLVVLNDAIERLTADRAQAQARDKPLIDKVKKRKLGEGRKDK